MIFNKQIFATVLVAGSSIFLFSCKKDKDPAPMAMEHSLTVQNILASRPLVASGTFMHSGASPLIMPGDSISFSFYAGGAQALYFVTMYGWSNDLFFAPENPGIQVYDDMGNPIEGDVSGQVKLWDNGSRVNQVPGSGVMHPGVAEASPQNITEVAGTDAQGHTYAAASQLMNVMLHYEGNSKFKVTIKNVSGATSNPTPFSPGVWAISYSAGGALLDASPLYKKGQPAANGITPIAEMGDNTELAAYIEGRTGIFTPLSPILVVIYRGIENPIYKTGAPDAGHGLAKLAQMGDASELATYLKGVAGVKEVYVLPAANTTVLLPMIDGQEGGQVSQSLSVETGDKIAIATMYGLSNDWFFASEGEIDATKPADLSGQIGLFDDGTAVSEFPGAGASQAALGGTPIAESNPISKVPNPNAFTTLPPIDQIIKVTIQ
jgi:hypothetical protein